MPHKVRFFVPGEGPVLGCVTLDPGPAQDPEGGTRPWVMLLDHSASMRGACADLRDRLIDELEAEARTGNARPFLAMSFGSDHRWLVGPDPVALTPDNMPRITAGLGAYVPGGRTVLAPALRAFVRHVPRHAHAYVFSDGAITETEEWTNDGAHARGLVDDVYPDDALARSGTRWTVALLGGDVGDGSVLGDVAAALRGDLIAAAEPGDLVAAWRDARASDRRVFAQDVRVTVHGGEALVGRVDRVVTGTPATAVFRVDPDVGESWGAARDVQDHATGRRVWIGGRVEVRWRDGDGEPLPDLLLPFGDAVDAQAAGRVRPDGRSTIVGSGATRLAHVRHRFDTIMEVELPRSGARPPQDVVDLCDEGLAIDEEFPATFEQGAATLVTPRWLRPPAAAVALLRDVFRPAALRQLHRGARAVHEGMEDTYGAASRSASAATRGVSRGVYGTAIPG